MTARERRIIDQLPLFPEHLEAMKRSRRPPEVAALTGTAAYVAPLRGGDGACRGWVGACPDGDAWMARVVIPGRRRSRVYSLRGVSLREALAAIRELAEAPGGGAAEWLA